MRSPDLLLPDEASVGIDPLARCAFWRTITALAQAGGTIIAVVERNRAQRSGQNLVA